MVTHLWLVLLTKEQLHIPAHKVAVVSSKRTNGGLRLQVRKTDIGRTMEQKKKKKEKIVPLRG